MYVFFSRARSRLKFRFSTYLFRIKLFWDFESICNLSLKQFNIRKSLRMETCNVHQHLFIAHKVRFDFNNGHQTSVNSTVSGVLNVISRIYRYPNTVRIMDPSCRYFTISLSSRSMSFLIRDTCFEIFSSDDQGKDCLDFDLFIYFNCTIIK